MNGILNIDNLVGVSVSNKNADKADPRLYKLIVSEFSKLKGFWSKAFFISLLQKAQSEQLRNCAEKLNLELKVTEHEVYERFLKHFMLEIKKDRINGNIVNNKKVMDAWVEYGDTEAITLCRLINNCGLAIKLDSQLPKKMVDEMNQPY